MLGYVTLGTNDLEKSIAFYDALMAEYGAKRIWEGENGVGWGSALDAPSLATTRPYNGEPATFGNGTMVGLTVSSPADVDRLYAKAIALGAQDDGPPGERWPGFYAAYFRDLDNNKLAFFHLKLEQA